MDSQSDFWFLSHDLEIGLFPVRNSFVVAVLFFCLWKSWQLTRCLKDKLQYWLQRCTKFRLFESFCFDAHTEVDFDIFDTASFYMSTGNNPKLERSTCSASQSVMICAAKKEVSDHFGELGYPGSVPAIETILFVTGFVDLLWVGGCELLHQLVDGQNRVIISWEIQWFTLW